VGVGELDDGWTVDWLVGSGRLAVVGWQWSVGSGRLSVGGGWLEVGSSDCGCWDGTLARWRLHGVDGGSGVLTVVGGLNGGLLLFELLNLLLTMLLINLVINIETPNKTNG
jgi:hypothetical protein